MNKKEHWENIYETKPLETVSWYQPVPSVAIAYLAQLEISKQAALIDVGGGDSFFVDYLIENQFENITILDISEKALQRAQQRLGAKAKRVKWIVADASKFKSETKFDFWYDRAAFHFLTDAAEIASYIKGMEQHLNPKAQVVIGTFSEKGPTKCSGIAIKQYAAPSLAKVLASGLKCISCQEVEHPTPFGTIQSFTFCHFEKIEG